MAYKLIFRFDRNRYTGSPSPKERNQQIFNDIMKKQMILELNAQDIIHPAEIVSKYFFPQKKNSIKHLKRQIV